jgi:AcrR family transcriptional regulator
LTRPPRSDAVRNRERLLEAARGLFAAEGVDVSLDEIARSAGLGPGTLHRHFRTKRELIAAVLVDDLATVVGFAEDAAAAGAPEALYSVFGRLLDLAAGNRALKDVVGLADDRDQAVDDLLARLWSAVRTLLARGQKEQSVRRDLDLSQARRLLAALIDAEKGAAPDERASIRRIVFDGMRPQRAAADRRRLRGAARP